MSKAERLESLLRKAKDPACSFEEAAAARNMAEKLMKELGETRKSKEKIFIQGLFTKEPPEGSPPWVMFSLTINKVELIDWLLQKHKGDWVNAQVCRSKSTGKFYAEENQWRKP